MRVRPWAKKRETAENVIWQIDFINTRYEQHNLIFGQCCSITIKAAGNTALKLFWKVISFRSRSVSYNLDKLFHYAALPTAPTLQNIDVRRIALCVAWVPHMSTSCFFLFHFLLNDTFLVLHPGLRLFVPSWALLSSGAEKCSIKKNRRERKKHWSKIISHTGVLVIFKNQLIFMEMCLWFMTAKKDAKRFKK